jgi:hypothetical protein
VTEAAPSARPSRITPILAAAGLALITSIISWTSCGPSLGLVIATLTLATLIVAPLAAASSARFVMIGTIVAIGAIWIVAFTGTLGLITALKMLLVLASYLFAVTGIVVLLARVSIHPTIGAAIAVMLAITWLSWPIWLSGHLSEGRTLAALVAAHPIFAINGTSDTFGVWTQQHLMYRLTALGQDVPFALPRSILPCVLAHAVVGALCLVPRLSASHSDHRPSAGSVVG